MTTEHRPARWTPRAWTAAVALFWAGLVLGVSFIATPAKFLAASLSLATALDVGNHTFHVLTRVELGIGIVLAVLGWWAHRGRWWAGAVWLLPLIAVIVQVVVLLPPLDARVQVIIAGGTPTNSDLHVVYIGLELAKFVLLLVLGLWALARAPQDASS
jgi:hypothetical protein